MKALLTIYTALLLTMSMAHAQSTAFKPVYCDSFIEIVRSLIGNQHQEIPIWRGGADRSGFKIVLFYNTTSTAFTLVEYKDDQACILGVGEGSELNHQIADTLRNQ